MRKNNEITKCTVAECAKQMHIFILKGHYRVRDVSTVDIVLQAERGLV